MVTHLVENLELSGYYADAKKARAAKANIIQMHQNKLAAAQKQKAAIDHNMQNKP